MKLGYKDDIMLLIEMFLAIIYHFGKDFVKARIQLMEKKQRMREFNELLDSNLFSLGVLRSLKILIHNYESLENKNILNIRNEEELRRAVDNLKIMHQTIFLKNTVLLNVIVFGATVIPGFVYFIRKRIKKQM